MDAKELAQALNGIEYPPEISRELCEQAREAGLVIVHGAGDDLVEFEGAISDERGCYGGKTFVIDGKGLQLSFERARDDGEDALRDYFAREGKGKALKALWCAEPGYSWTYQTDIPHETFEVIEDGEPYCRGIVFRLADAETKTGGER